MKRREFISLLGGALAAAPFIAHAQPGKKIPTVAYLWHAGSAKEESPYYFSQIPIRRCHGSMPRSQARPPISLD
jgi:hypothetical protein